MFGSFQDVSVNPKYNLIFHGATTNLSCAHPCASYYGLLGGPMKFLILILAFLCGGNICFADNATQIINGSCTSFSAGNCRCDALTNNRIENRGFDCAILRCEQFQGYQNNQSCKYPAGIATCVLQNKFYQNGCVEDVPLLLGKTPVETCVDVTECLNNDFCSKDYCGSPNVRRNWILLDARSNL